MDTNKDLDMAASLAFRGVKVNPYRPSPCRGVKVNPYRPSPCRGVKVNPLRASPCRACVSGVRYFRRCHPTSWSYPASLALGFLAISCLLQSAGGLLVQNGTYVLCATTPEQFHQRVTGRVMGGVDTMKPLEREPCPIAGNRQARWRNYDGTCNAPDDRGAAFSYVKRYFPANFQKVGDQIDGPRIFSTVDGSLLPSARTVSRAVHRSRHNQSDFTLLLMQLGQLLDHDMSAVPVATELDDTIRCCGVPKDKLYRDCFPIEVTADDPQFSECMEFVRSEPITFRNGSVPSPRIHMNAITAFLDASFIYGNDRIRARELRTQNGSGALLKTRRYKGKERLPQGNQDDCIMTAKSEFCALAGDDRVNEQPGLTAVHLAFHLEHNRLVRRLARQYLYNAGAYFATPDVEFFLESAATEMQERLYQTARKILGAIWQNVVYREYLPLVIGPSMMTRYALWAGAQTHWDQHVDPSIATEFVTSAFRYGHTLVNDMMLTDQMRSLKELFGVSRHNLDNYTSIISGLVSPLQHAMAFDPHMAPSLTDHLFENNKDNMPGLDLAAINLQRGRDHGLPSYNEMREALGLRRREAWRDFGKYGNTLGQIYRHPDDVDSFTGGTTEPTVAGGVVGETFAHLLGMQFHDLKYGDRFFFEHLDPAYGFTDDQLRSLRMVCLSKILCENADLQWVQLNPFKKADYYRNRMIPCEQLPDIDTWYFTDYLADDKQLGNG